MKMTGHQKKALFVCLGNTCRSPIAEAVFMDEVKKAEMEQNWKVDSAAIENWHVGSYPNRRSVAIMQKYNLAYDNRARQIRTSDFLEFDYIFGMDDDNVYDLRQMYPDDGTAKIFLLGDFDPEGVRNIRDPYCDTDSRGFEKCYQQAVRCCKSFLQLVKENRI